MRRLAVTLGCLFAVATVGAFALGYIAIFGGSDAVDNAAGLTGLLAFLLGIGALGVALLCVEEL